MIEWRTGKVVCRTRNETSTKWYTVMVVRNSTTAALPIFSLRGSASQSLLELLSRSPRVKIYAV